MNTFKMPDGRTLRIPGNKILVERQKLTEVSPGGIIMPNREREDATAVGIIRAVGTLAVKKPAPGGPQRIPIDILEPGLYCAFVWFHAESHTNQQLQKIFGKNFALLQWEDISFVWPADEKHEVSDMKSLGR